MPPEAVLSRLEHVRSNRRGWLARCPAHADRSPSLSIGVGAGGRVLLHCFAGCEPAAVLARIGLSWRDVVEGRDHPRLRPSVTRPSPEEDVDRQCDGIIDELRAIRMRRKEITDECAGSRVLEDYALDVELPPLAARETDLLNAFAATADFSARGRR